MKIIVKQGDVDGGNITMGGKGYAKMPIAVRLIKLRSGILKNLRLNHPGAYFKLQCMKYFHTPEFKRLLQGYFIGNKETVTFVIEHLGEMYPNEIVYYMSHGEQKKIPQGFFALLRVHLEQLTVAEKMGFAPFIKWGEGTAYYDREMPEQMTNIFEYYFKPVSHISGNEVLRCRNVIRARPNHPSYFLEHDVITGYDYNILEKDIEKLGAIYKEYIHLNDKTRAYLEHELVKTLSSEKTLGVHVRGTDYNVGFARHPKVISPQEYLDKTKEMFIKGEYDRVFLATDDLNALALFVQEFGEKLVYYEDTKRSDSNIGSFSLPDSRPLHHYKLGLEVLRDVYTLACCDGLIAGKSHVSVAARYISIALDRSFKDLIILDKGLNK